MRFSWAHDLWREGRSFGEASRESKERQDLSSKAGPIGYHRRWEHQEAGSTRRVTVSRCFIEQRWRQWWVRKNPVSRAGVDTALTRVHFFTFSRSSGTRQIQHQKSLGKDLSSQRLWLCSLDRGLYPCFEELKAKSVCRVRRERSRQYLCQSRSNRSI